METKGKVTLDLCSVCWHTCGPAYPHACFHGVEQQPDLAVEGSGTCSCRQHRGAEGKLNQVLGL